MKNGARKHSRHSPEVLQLSQLPPQIWTPVTFVGVEIGDLYSGSATKRIRCNIYFAAEEYAVEATPFEMGRLRYIKTSEVVRKRMSLNHIHLNSEGRRVWREGKRGGPRNLTYLGLQLVDDAHMKQPAEFDLYDPRLDGTLYLESVNEALALTGEMLPADKSANQFISNGVISMPSANLWLWANSETYATLKAKRGSTSGIRI